MQHFKNPAIELFCSGNVTMTGGTYIYTFQWDNVKKNSDQVKRMREMGCGEKKWMTYMYITHKSANEENIFTYTNAYLYHSMLDRPTLPSETPSDILEVFVIFGICCEKRLFLTCEAAEVVYSPSGCFTKQSHVSATATTTGSTYI